MSEKLGNSATVEVSSDGGTTYTAVGEVKDPTYTPNVDRHDSTTNDDGNFKTELLGHTQATLAFTCNHDEADAGQLAILSAHESRTTLTWRYRSHGNTSGKKQRVFAGNTDLEVSDPTQGISEMSVTVTSTGTITTSTIS